MAPCNRSSLIRYIVFSCLLFLSCPLVLFAREPENPIKPDVQSQMPGELNDGTAVFIIHNRPESFVDVRLDGIKILSRSLNGPDPVRIVIDHLASGWHRVTFRLARPDQYEFGEEQVFRIRVPAPISVLRKDHPEKE
jgi:hypothetical protein